MSLYKTAKEKAVEHAVTTVIGLFVILGVIIWQAIPSTLWERISDARDKKVLWAIIGLLSLVVIGETVYLIKKYLDARTILHFYGGALWNSNCELFCQKRKPRYSQQVKHLTNLILQKKELKFSNVQNVIVPIYSRTQMVILLHLLKLRKTFSYNKV